MPHTLFDTHKCRWMHIINACICSFFILILGYYKFGIKKIVVRYFWSVLNLPCQVTLLSVGYCNILQHQHNGCTGEMIPYLFLQAKFSSFILCVWKRERERKHAIKKKKTFLSKQMLSFVYECMYFLYW